MSSIKMIKYDNLKGVSARLYPEDMKKFKELMSYLKNTHGPGFSLSLSLLIQVVLSMDKKALDELIIKYQGVKSITKKLDLSDEAKAEIEAILKRESANKG